MAGGRGAVIAVLGFGAGLAAAAGVLVRRSDSREGDATRISTEVRSAVESAVSGALGDLGVEGATGAAIPQLQAALRNKVDPFTMDDLLETERWWAPYRSRSILLVGPGGTLVKRNEPTGGLGGADLVQRAASGRGARAVVRLSDGAYLEAALAVDGPELPRWTLVIARRIDRDLIDEWSQRAQAGLVLSDGSQGLLSGTDAAGARPVDMVGRERDPMVLDPTGDRVAVPCAIGAGLWLWAVRPLPPGPSRTWVGPLWAASALLGAAALIVWAARRQRQGAPVVAPSSVAPHTSALEPVATSANVTAAAPAAPADNPAQPPPTPLPGRSSASFPTMIASSEPEMFGRYTVIDRLGEGGMCNIFIAGLAGPEGFQRTFVLKRLKPEVARNRAAVDQFIDEAKLGSTLVHSNIVPVFDFGKVGDGYFMAQEYVVGRNVAELVDRHMERLREPLDEGTVLYIAYEALQALGYAHDRTNDAGEPLHLVHRDVSPGNIVVSTHGEVKLIDFGIVKAEGRVSHTDMGNVKGNAAFMAPEQARGLAVDGRADLFSLGLVMYYALFGHQFYPGATAAERFYAAATGPSAEQLERLKKLPPVAARVVARALAPDPAQRYATADEFAADLVDHVAGGARPKLATLLHALFGPELRPLSGGRPGSGGATATSGLGRRTG